MDLGLVAQFVVSASSLDELFLEVKDSSLTDFVDDQEIVNHATKVYNTKMIKFEHFQLPVCKTDQNRSQCNQRMNLGSGNDYQLIQN